MRLSGQENDTQGSLARCLGPSVESGALGDDGTADDRTDEPISGMEQSRTVSNVGATRFEQPAISPGKMEVRVFGGAESGAVQAGRRPDPVLDMVAARWPTLTAEQRLAIVEIATAEEPAIRHG